MFRLKSTRIEHAIAALIIIAACLPLTVLSQCVDHPERKTSLQFSNQTKYELTFFVDEDEDGTIVSAINVSGEVPVVPGPHMLRARVRINGESIWVWTVNVVPQGQLCTWTITDP